MKRSSCFVAGLVLLVWGGMALMYALRAEVSQWHYYQGKYGVDRGNINQLIPRSRQAIKYYPAHYRVCLYAAEETLRQAELPGATNAPELLIASLFWCERGLALNAYPTTLRWVKARLLSKEDPAQAAFYWERYTDWHFWEPYNHAFLAQLYAQAGRLQDAENELRWVKGSPYFSDTYAALCQARKKNSSGTETGDASPLNN